MRSALNGRHRNAKQEIVIHVCAIIGVGDLIGKENSIAMEGTLSRDHRASR